MSQRCRPKLALLPAPRLLETESQDEYNRISNAITKSIKPRDAMEEIWVSDIIYLEWVICACGVAKRVLSIWQSEVPPVPWFESFAKTWKSCSPRIKKRELRF